MVPIDPSSAEPLYRQIDAALRRDILEGRLASGRRLPSTRVLARELGVSRNTVLLAFEQLLAEGYLDSRRGDGTYVAVDLPDDLLTAPRSPRASAPPSGGPPSGGPPSGGPPSGAPRLSRVAGELMLSRVPRSGRPPRAFQPGIPALDVFPRKLWERLHAKHLRRQPVADLAYSDPAGHRPLREALAAYLHGSRGLRCEAEQILIVGGSQQGLDLVARALLNPGDRVWVEDPGYPGARAALRAAGAELVAVPVDADGLEVSVGRRSAPDARLAVVAPSHQYPTGAVLGLRRRLELLEWARVADAWIVEDDYDSEYRYSGRPLAALKSLDGAAERVIYLGTFSKVLTPSLRLGYMVVPDALIDPLLALRYACDRQSPPLTQAVLAEFLEVGHFARHVRRMRMLYAERQAVLVGAAAELAGRLEISPSPAGLHLVGRLPEGVDDRDVSERLMLHGVAAPPMADYAVSRRTPPGLVMGYAAYDEPEIRAALEILDRLLPRRSLKPKGDSR